MRRFPGSGWTEASLGAVLLIAAVLLGTPAGAQSLDDEDWSATVAGTEAAPIADGLGQALPVKLELDDRVAALQAIQFTLDEVGDGSTYLWHRKAGELHGFVRPVQSYLDDQGRVCRRLKLALTVGEFSREVEGTACRAEDRRWLLEN
jgi:surface antigen